MNAYADFLTRKAARAPQDGLDVDTAAAYPMLRDWQAEIVDWAARVGRAAIWADVPGITRNEALKACGNGVVPQQAAAALRLMLARAESVAA